MPTVGVTSPMKASRPRSMTPMDRPRHSRCSGARAAADLQVEHGSRTPEDPGTKSAQKDEGVSHVDVADPLVGNSCMPGGQTCDSAIPTRVRTPKPVPCLGV